MAAVGLLAAADVAGIGIGGATLAGQHSKDPVSTVVEIATGSPELAAGSVPHIALWDFQGNRIGQYHGNRNGHIDANSSSTITVEHNQNGHKEATAEYISVVMNEKDSLCISAVVMSGNMVQWTWLGEVAKYCGAQWYPSSRIVGSDTNPPACAWIDQDHSKGGKAQGFSLHMPDFAANDARIQQYVENPDSLCKSSPRMTFWPAIVPDAIPPFFNPPLHYTNPGAKGDDPESELAAVGGADVDAQKVIDRKTNSYPDAHRKKDKRNRPARRDNSNLREDHLVISDHLSHSAKEVCEDPKSVGWDFVSTSEGVFCDLSAREWWPLCSEAVNYDCFDLDKKTMRGNEKGHGVVNRRDGLIGRAVPEKIYGSSERWSR